jgi:DNA-binding winged helix-turn-helix (wHTH) protein/tetratricopeptide (TPR) repeat protein
MDAPQSRRTYRFGLFEADSSSGELLRRGSRVKLQDQPFRLLIVLLEQAGAVVSREQLRQQLWPSDTYVEFDGSLNNTLKKLRSALGDTAENPTFIETLPKRGYRFIAPVTVLDTPRTSSQPDLAASSATSGVELTHRRARGNRRRAILLAVVFILIFAALVASYHRLELVRQRNQLLVQPQAKPRLSVAILGFNNASGRPQDAWLSTALSEMLSTELAQGEKLRVVSGEDVAQLRLVAPWTQTDTLGQETTARLGNSLSSDLLVLGSYTSVGRVDHRQLRLDVRLQESVSGNILTEIAEAGNEEDLFRLTSSVGNKLHQKLGMTGPTEVEQAGAMASLPSNAEAARFYALGLDRVRQFDAVAAKDLFEQAIKADPKFPLAHSMLARAWSQLGYEQKRKQEAKKALDLSANLPRADRMLVEGDYYESLPDHAKAASVYQALFALFPDSVEYGLQLASTQFASGHGSQATETLAQLRRLPRPASNDPRIDLVEARTITDKSAAVILVRNAVAKASAQGKKLVYAQARRDECMNLIYGDHPEQGTASCEDAYKVFLAAGNRLGAADALRLIGDEQGAEGHSEQAIATYQRVLAILQELGEEHTKTGAVLNNMAVDFANEGKLERAEQLYRQAKVHFEQAGDGFDVATTVGNIADILYLRGDLPAAAKLYEQDVKLETVLDPPDPSYAMYRLADLKLAQGRVKEAQPLAQQAVDILRPMKGGYQYLTSAMVVLGDALRAEGDLKSAGEQYQSALDIRKKMGEASLAAESQVSLADLALDENQPQQAEAVLHQAIPEFEKEQGDPDAISAYVVLSRALLMEGRLDEARSAAQHAATLVHSSSDPALRLSAAIQNARIEAAGKGNEASQRLGISAAEKQLRSAAMTAKGLGYYQLECEARLALGELEMKNDPALGRSQLAALKEEAGARGLQLIFREADRTLTGLP